MKRLIISVVLFSLVFTGIGYGQGSKPVKSISLEQLLGKKKTENAVQSAQQGYREHIGAIGSVLERIELKGNSLTQDKISTPYRRYVINGTMDLGGKTISIPDGCILDLEQGSLKNGSLKMNTTLVTPIYGISKERNISKVKVSGEYYETLVDLWGEQTEPLFPWDTTAPKKVYLVDLKKFGITPGYQRRESDNHYTDKQYDLMYNNGIGFTKAIRWAYDNGYDGIRFPKNDYCFTPRTTKNDKPQEGPMVLVQDYEKYDIDLGGGSYYLILDSKRKSKYYVNSPEKPYAQGGTMFFIAACINLQIHNGKMVGDRALRDYKEPAEATIENTYGIILSGYCQNIRIHRIEFYDFMGDGTSSAQSGGIWREYDSPFHNIGRAYPGVYKPIDSDKDYSSICDYFSIKNLYSNSDALKLSVVRKMASMRLFSVNNNLGYTRLINPYHNVEILTFNESQTVDIPIRKIRTSYLETIVLNNNETGLKIRCLYEDGLPAEYKHSVTISELIGSHVIIEYCAFVNNHRGGISGGSNDVTIRYCSFYKSYKNDNYSGTHIPLFVVGGTNYHINFEDSYAKDLKVYKCTFYRSSDVIGKILLGVYTLDFHDNISDTPVYLYNSLFCDIHDNMFSSSPLWLASWRLSDYDGKLKPGLKHIIRIAFVHNNVIKSEFPYRHNRTIVYSYNND